MNCLLLRIVFVVGENEIYTTISKNTVKDNFWENTFFRNLHDK